MNVDSFVSVAAALDSVPEARACFQIGEDWFALLIDKNDQTVEFRFFRNRL